MATSDVSQETYLCYQRRFIALFTQAIATTTDHEKKTEYQQSLQDARDDLTLAYQAIAPGEEKEIAAYKQQEKTEAENELHEEFKRDRDALRVAYLQLQTAYLRALADILGDYRARGIIIQQQVNDFVAEYASLREQLPATSKFAVFKQIDILLQRYPIIDGDYLAKIVLEKLEELENEDVVTNTHTTERGNSNGNP